MIVQPVPKPKNNAEALYVNCDTYLEEADEFLDFIWSLPGADMVKSFPMIFMDGKPLVGIKNYVLWKVIFRYYFKNINSF